MTNASHARRLKQEDLAILGLLRAGNAKMHPTWKRTK
jgi:hypothetical protein